MSKHNGNTHTHTHTLRGYTFINILSNSNTCMLSIAVLTTIGFRFLFRLEVNLSKYVACTPQGLKTGIVQGN